ncbi:MAG: DUF1326 domain-containing protein [Pseudomonadota bacterium]
MDSWTIDGELILNCNCTVFCPCVVSLGKHPPTEGYCQAWMGVRIDKGTFNGEDLSGLNVGMMLDIPGEMARGNWKAAAYIDERASDAAYDGLVKIFSGQARGTTGLFSMLVGEFLGAERQPVSYETEGKTRRLVVGRKIKGAVAPIEGADPDQEVMVTNTGYWMGADVTIAMASQGRVRDRGRVWDFDGRSAEICQIAWSSA